MCKLEMEDDYRFTTKFDLVVLLFDIVMFAWLF